MNTKLVLAIVLAVMTGAAAQERGAPAERERALSMFARSYFPGRSGQIMIVPREGAIVDLKARSGRAVHARQSMAVRHENSAAVLWPALRPHRYVHACRSTAGCHADGGRTARHAGPADRYRPPADRSARAFSASAARRRHRGARRHAGGLFRSLCGLMPTLNRLRRAGAWFANTTIDYLPSITSLGHATVSTGTDPRYHGTTGNSLFDRVSLKPQDTFAGNNPRDLMVLNVADTWNLHTGGRAVIVAQGSSGPAAVGLAGHGACLFGAVRYGWRVTAGRAASGRRMTPAITFRIT